MINFLLNSDKYVQNYGFNKVLSAIVNIKKKLKGEQLPLKGL